GQGQPVRVRARERQGGGGNQDGGQLQLGPASTRRRTAPGLQQRRPADADGRPLTSPRVRPWGRPGSLRGRGAEASPALLFGAFVAPAAPHGYLPARLPPFRDG